LAFILEAFESRFLIREKALPPSAHFWPRWGANTDSNRKEEAGWSWPFLFLCLEFLVSAGPDSESFKNWKKFYAEIGSSENGEYLRGRF
jgi:hypothetical protein